MATKSSGSIELSRPERGILIVPIVGETPLIVHKWSEKALKQMRDKQFGKNVRPIREPKNPEEEAFASTYWMPDGRGAMPAVAFKAAMVGACRLHEGLPMTMAKVALFVQGQGTDQLVPIDGPYEMHEDTPRNDNGAPDLRYRNYFFPWSTTLEIHYIKGKLNEASVISLVDSAGYGGVGDWRPSAPKSATGSFGRFRIDESKQIHVVK